MWGKVRMEIIQFEVYIETGNIAKLWLYDDYWQKLLNIMQGVAAKLSVLYTLFFLPFSSVGLSFPLLGPHGILKQEILII